ncbi:hypothetical protein FGO68_gene4901 [Halteria grandinella]|uniref:Protein kinase domain-containing protein n=1 Tax=Halteria grandinella TaxID=5974 RepID=A0A8J8NXZ8_HALGN|nr:hypothetical protein FGO68_gene4901 [Halteria grandinella]
MNELTFLKSTAHPFIIGYIEDFPSPFLGKHCIILEYADGCDLRKKMASMGHQITEDLAITWLAHVCLGLAEMHTQRLVHRDIKPDNILIVGEVAKLGDFGTIKKMSYGDTVDTLRVGTYKYFSPERGDNIKYQEEADIWSLGIVLYEMCTGGKFPFQYDFAKGNLDDYLDKLPFLELRQIPEHLSTECKTLINQMLEKYPQSRLNASKVLQKSIILEKIRQIVEDQILGEEIALKIRDQILTLEIQLPQKSQFEEQIQLLPLSSTSKQSTATNSINSQKLALSLEQQLSLQSEESKQSLPTLEQNKFSQVTIDNFLNMIREKGHTKLIEVSLQHGLTLNLLNCNQTKEVRQLEFEGNEFFEKGGTYYGECVEGLRDGWGLLYCIHTQGPECLFECEWTHGVPVKGKRVLIEKDQWHYYQGQFDARMIRTGTGRWEHEDGRTYEGEWRDGKSNGQGNETYADGGTYQGEFKDDKRHGHGKIVYADGDIYEGEWKDGEFSGYGKYIWEDGRVYEGEFKNGKQNGQGKITWPDGETYEGEWKDGYYSGQGKQTKPDGQIYEGGWKEGNKHGQGKVAWPDGDTYEGEWKDNMMNGKGKYIWADGRIYEGEFKDNKREGQGKMIYPDGKVYEGQWKDGKMNGTGKYIWADGAIYEGEYKDNKREGQGKMIYPDGKVYEGQWKNENKNGIGRVSLADGRTYEGELKDDKYHGKGKFTWPDGRIYEGEWKDDKGHGTGRLTFKNGEYEEGQYEGNNPIGVHKYYSKEDKLIKLITFENGEVVKEEEVKKKLFGLF